MRAAVIAHAGDGVELDYAASSTPRRSSRSSASTDGPRLRRGRVGATRLIDNVRADDPAEADAARHAGAQ